MLGLGVGFTSPAVLWGGGGGAAGAVGGAALLEGEADGFAADFTYATDAQRVAVKASGVVTEYAVDAFFGNAGTSPKQVFDVAGTLAWSPHNMLLRSEDFTASWTVSGTPVVTAHTIQDDDAAGTEYIVSSAMTIVTGATYTITAWILKDAVTSRFPAMMAITSANRTVQINTSTGETAIVSSTLVGSHAVVDTGTHWQLSITFVADAGSFGVRIYPARGNTVSTNDPSAVGTITVDKVQVNRGSVPTAYLPTTTAARFGLAPDHDPVTHAAKGLLCEPAGTNVQASSVDGTNATYWALTGMTAARGVTAPNGQAEATTLTETIATSIHYMFAAAAGRPGLTAVPYTFSVYLKAGTRRYVTVAAQTSSNGFYVTVDTQAWTITNSANMGTGWTYASSSLQAAGNGWYRVAVTGTPAAASLIFVIQGSTTATGAFSESYLGNGSTIIWWGIQVETGTVATSHVPTFAGTATRAVDKYSCTPAQINHSATAGSWWAEWVARAVTTNGRLIGYLAQAAGPLFVNVNKFSLYAFGSAALENTVAWAVETTCRQASAFTSGSRAVTGNGASVAADTGVVTDFLAPGATINIGNDPFNSATPFNGHIRKAYYLPRRMTNTELQDKTV